MNRLVFFYKVVEGLVTALQCHDILTPVRGKRLIKTRQYIDCVTSNIVERQSINNTKCFKPVQCNSEIFRKSFLLKTVIDWNYLEESVVCAETVDGLCKSRLSLGLIILPSSLPFARMLKGSAMCTFRFNFRFRPRKMS